MTRLLVAVLSAPRILVALAALAAAPLAQAETVCYFDGSTYINMGKGFPLGNSVSLSAWVRVDPQITTKKPYGASLYGAGIVGQGYWGGATGLGILANGGVQDTDTSNDAIAWQVRNSSGLLANDKYSDQTLFTAGEWHHYLLVRDKENGKARFYVDGALCGEEKDCSSSASITPTHNFAIGKNIIGTGGCFCGWIADVALWGVALTAEEASLLPTVGVQGIPGKPPYAYFPLDEGSGNSVTGTDNGSSLTCSANGTLVWTNDISFCRVTTGDRLLVSTAPFGVGSPSPSSVRTGLAAGQAVEVSCGATPWTNAAETVYYDCTGWKLYDKNGTVVSNGTETTFTYRHPSPSEFRRLEWQWEDHATAYGALPKAIITKMTPKSDGAAISWGILDYGIGSSAVDIYLDYAETDDFANATTVQIGDDIGDAVPTTGSYTLTGLSSGQTRYARLRFVNDGGHTTTSTAISFLTRSTGTYTWTGNGTAGKWDDKDNWGGTDYPRSGDKVVFSGGATADLTFDNDAHTLCTLSEITVYAADVKITIPANDYPFVNSLGALCLYNSEADKIGRLEVVAPTDADASRYSGYAGCHVGDRNSPDCCNNFLILHNMTSSRADFSLGKDAPGCTNNWITLKNSSVSIGNIQYARGKGNGIIIDDEGFGSSFANQRVGVENGAAVIARPGSTLATGGQTSFILCYASSQSGLLYATNAIMRTSSWQFKGVSSTALVHRCTGSLFSYAANGGDNSYLEISESVMPKGIGDAPAIGGTGEIRISDSFVTNNSILVTAKDVYATNTVMVSPPTGFGANQAWRMKNTSADYESTYVADGGGIVQVGYGGVGYEWGSGSFRNNTLRLRNGAYACFPYARIAAGGQGQGYSALYPDSDYTNNWLIVESGSQFGGSIDANNKANGYVSFALGYTKNGLVVTDPGSAAWIKDQGDNRCFTAGTNCTIRVANGATLKAGALKLRGTRFEFAGDSRGETAFVANTAVTLSDGAKLQFEPETAKGWKPVPFAKIVSTAASANTVKILAGPSFRRGGASHLTLATYTENANVAFTLDPESKPSNIELHCDATELWAKIPSNGLLIFVR